MSDLLEVGAAAPAFVLPSTLGHEVSAESLHGRPWVLFFYPRDNTPGCTQEACDFRDHSSAFAELGVAVFGVSQDSLRSHEGFIRKHNLTMPLLSDADHAVHAAFGAWGEKVLYGKKSVGPIRTTALVDAQGRVHRLWRKVKVQGHVQEVLDAAAALVAKPG